MTSIPSGKALAGDIPAKVTAADPLAKGGQPSDAGATANASDRQPISSLQSAQLTSQISKGDVKIALQGEQFGSVELHAKVTGDQLSASITVEHHETHALLTGELPALHQMLNERQLRVSEIILLHDSLLSGGSTDDNSPAKQEDSMPQQNSGAKGDGGDASPFPSSGPDGRAGTDPIFNSQGRLSVRA